MIEHRLRRILRLNVTCIFSDENLDRIPRKIAQDLPFTCVQKQSLFAEIFLNFFGKNSLLESPKHGTRATVYYFYLSQKLTSNAFPLISDSTHVVHKVEAKTYDLNAQNIRRD